MPQVVRVCLTTATRIRRPAQSLPRRRWTTVRNGYGILTRLFKLVEEPPSLSQIGPDREGRINGLIEGERGSGRGVRESGCYTRKA
jgi:hypothetical protein